MAPCSGLPPSLPPSFTPSWGCPVVKSCYDHKTTLTTREAQWRPEEGAEGGLPCASSESSIVCTEFKSNNETSTSRSPFYYHSALAVLTKAGEKMTPPHQNLSLVHVLNNHCGYR